MPRPSLGVRKQVNVRLPIDLVERIDTARGVLSRDSWMERAAELALKPTSFVADQQLRQQTHEHSIGRPLRTEVKGGVKRRVYECAGGCGMEVTAQ